MSSTPESPSLESGRPPLRLLLSVALLSAAVLGFEVSLTRVFAVLLRYHFAFLVISIALCGLGVGGYASHWWRQRRTVSLPMLAISFGATVAIALALMLRVIFAFYPDAFWLAALVVLVPFSLAGAFLSEVFARNPLWSGRLYAWDLAGAAAAALIIVGVLQIISAIDACLFSGAMGAVAGFLLLTDRATGEANAEQKRRENIGFAVPVVLLVLTVANVGLRFLDIPAVPPKLNADEMSLADRGVTQPLFTELGTPNHTSKIVETRWNAFARTDVVEDSSMPDTYYLYTNGNVPTNMMKWDGKLTSIGPIAQNFPLSDWAFRVAPLGAPQPKTRIAAGEEPKGSVLAIGPGGGLDALLALRHGAKHFDGAEINPSIVKLMHDYREFNGRIYERPDINVVTAEGRAYVRSAVAANKRYALLFSALTKTATAGQGMALLESFVYTTDAFTDYLNALEDNGQMTIVLDSPVMLARFFTTAVQVLKAKGLDERAACRQIAMVNDPRPGVPYAFALVVQKSPFTRDQTYLLEDSARERSLQPIWIPDQTANQQYGPYTAVANGQMNLEQFIATYRDPNFLGESPPLDVEPCPDDRPFVLDLSLSTLPVFKQLAAFAALLSLGFIAVSWRSGATAGSEAARLQGSDALFILYFLALGVGFMLVEIPLAQKLILPLGYPTLALTVILFSVLLGGGIGSWFSQRFEDSKLRLWAMGCAIGVAVFTLLSTWVLDIAGDALLAMPLLTRCIVTALLLMPLGFLLGTPFPSGLRLFARTRAAQVPLIWGLNGVASVIGSLYAAMGAKNMGFSAIMLVGAAIYVGAAVILMQAGREPWRDPVE